MIDIRLVDEAPDVKACTEWLLETECGGIDIFIGKIRSINDGKHVVQISFEAYKPMALKELKHITDHVSEQWKVARILIHHRLGMLRAGDIPVIVGVSASHRAEAFEACRYIIDTLKQNVPIWKKEYYENGSVWINAHA
jgi:molybdopterin synthase catalytic subunit